MDFLGGPKKKRRARRWVGGFVFESRNEFCAARLAIKTHYEFETLPIKKRQSVLDSRSGKCRESNVPLKKMV